MRRSSVVSVVLLGMVLTLALSSSDVSSAGSMSADDALQVPAATQKQIPELTDAMAKLGKNDVKGALADMKTASEKHTQLPPAEILMAQVFSRTNQSGLVRFWVEKAVLESPNDPEAYIMLAQDSLQNKRGAEARLLFERAYDLLQKFDRNADRKKSLQGIVYGQLAALAMNRKDWDGAKGYLGELLKLQPDNSKGLQMLGRVLFEEGNVEGSLEKLKAAKSVNANMLTPEAMLGQWSEAAGKKKEAAQYMIRAIKAAPRDFKTRFVAANWALQTQRFNQAKDQASLAMEYADTPKEKETARLASGSIAIFNGNYPAAETFLKEAVANAPANFAATNNLALALCEQDSKAKQQLARQYAQVNVKLYPKNAEALSTYGRVLSQLEKYSDAEIVFRKLRNMRTQLSPDTVYYLADFYVKNNRPEDAKKLLSQAVTKEGLFAHRKDAEALLKKLGG